MTGTNCTLDAARHGPEKQRQLLRKERLAGGNLFFFLTAHANGRTLWNRAMIERGLHYLALAATGDSVSEYHLQAGIAACHCAAADESSTDWPRILALYDHLVRLNPSPIIALNRAVAVARAHGPQTGLGALHTLSPRASLDGYYLYHAVHGTFAMELGRTSEALARFQKAECLAALPSEREFLARRIKECEARLATLG